MERRGAIEIGMGYIVGGIIAVFVLIFIFYFLFFGKGQTIEKFFEFLPKFGETDKIHKGDSLIRYDIKEGDVDYYNGVNWLNLAEGNKIETSGKEFEKDFLKNKFMNYLISIDKIGEWDYSYKYNNKEEIKKFFFVNGFVDRFIVRYEFKQVSKILEIYYDGTIKLGSLNDGGFEIGSFDNDIFDNYVRYNLNVNDDKIDVLKLSDVELYNYVRKLAGYDLPKKGQSSDVYIIADKFDKGFVYRGDIYYEDVFSGLSGDIEGYRIDIGESKGDIYYNNQKLNVYLELNNWIPKKIMVSGIYEFNEVLKGVLRDVKEPLFNRIFSRKIVFSEKNYCVSFFDNRYLVVNLGKEVGEKDDCG